MKSMLKEVDDHGVIYQMLMIRCPGCALFGGDDDSPPTLFGFGLRHSGLHGLPVNTDKKRPSWIFNGDLWKPTLSPSILTGKDTPNVCHSFLVDGEFQFLADCTHSLVNQRVPIPDLPEWVVKEG